MSGLIERVRERVVIDDDGCWIWHGAYASGITPVMNIGGKTTNLRRLLAHELGLIDDNPARKANLATNSCGNTRCVCPEHIKMMTRKSLQTRTAKLFAATPAAIERKVKLRVIAIKQSKILQTPGMLEDLRYGPGSTRERAQRNGVSQHTVWRLQSGRRLLGLNPFDALMPKERRRA